MQGQEISSILRYLYTFRNIFGLIPKKKMDIFEKNIMLSEQWKRAPGCLGSKKGIILSFVIWIIVSHYFGIPMKTNQYFLESKHP